MASKWIPPMDRSKFIANMMGEFSQEYVFVNIFNATVIFSLVPWRCTDHAYVRFSDRSLGLGVGVLRHRCHLYHLECAVVLPGLRLTIRAPQDCRRGASLYRKRHWKLRIPQGTCKFQFNLIKIYPFKTREPLLLILHCFCTVQIMQSSA